MIDIPFDEWVNRNYAVSKIEEIDGILRSTGKRFFMLFPTRYAPNGDAMPPQEVDSTALKTGANLAREVTCTLIVSDAREHRMDEGVVAALLDVSCGPSRWSFERTKTLIDDLYSSRGPDIGLMFSHANDFATKLLVPLYRVQPPVWHDRLNNGCTLLLNCLASSVEYARRNHSAS